MKVQQVCQNINPFGGIHFVIKQCKQQGIGSFINEHLGKRRKKADYSYADGLLTVVYSHLCGASCLEDINTLGEHIGYYPGLQLPSADTAARIMNELKVDNTTINNEGVAHEFNYNEKLNDLLQKLCLKTSTINITEKYTLDYDNVIFENEKYDAAKTYKMSTGYQPGIAAIGKQVVFVEGRNGNTPAAYRMKETLQSCFEGLRKNNIHIEHFRSDSAAYQKNVIEVVEKNNAHFYIRIDDTQTLRDAISDIPEREWRKVKMNNQTAEMADTAFFPFDGKKAYRAVVQRRLRKDRQADAFTGSAYSYYAIMTDNEIDTNEWITDFYNGRGSSEKNFDILNNDFNCNRLPFSFLDANTVYIIIAALSNILFEWIKQVFYQRGVIATPTMRVKKFLFDFMLLPSKWIKTARQWVLKIFTYRTCYQPLFE